MFFKHSLSDKNAFKKTNKTHTRITPPPPPPKKKIEINHKI